MSIDTKGFKLPKPKKRSLGKIKNKDLWPIFSKYIRTRDCLRTTGCASWGLCITCNKRYHIKLLQAGHFLPGRHNANIFYEKGCHGQCYNCNINLRGNTLNYMDALIKLYGEEIVEELRENDRKTKKFTREELKGMIETYKKKLKELEG